MVLIKYRAETDTCNRWAVVPVIWLWDLLLWIGESDNMEVVAVEHGVESGLIIPREWWGYRPCVESIRISDAMTCVL